ncbi:MAG: type I glyceraldehyde-3-phosphate dehydrogenase [Candidatus Magasanikbacteria bacterium RIFCSPHIGHO2_02_FULL_51_14]|uniref:Glyceraldehyde-3-phosphate dehydrogenase n=1 Tax=Candidatus Magasanikbacteria bacterium RIFCSPHIGHO2_02_FULL_51_14 TaxID=1798683 RepID=A0A1F6MQL5_9BACT|nr:MAG: type I glyceraldehyde-3-phosphate dehydrogenase [Candidatus Magasanikbacteria bacterium RIFCSPHIGHO2_02_FULL_51_14]
MEYSPHSEEAKAKQKPLKVAINGFGRMGRIFTRLAWDNPRFIIVAINSRSDADIYAHLLKYDSIYGPWDYGVAHDGNEALVIDGKRIPLHHEADVARAPWRQYDIDVVIESTGVFRDRESSQKHIDAGAKYVAITAPAKDVDATLLYGINHREFDAKNHRVFSCASCTTACLAPVAKTLHETFGIVHGSVAAAHAYTNDQHLVDHPHAKHDFRRSRAASLSIVPSKTGAAKAIGEVLPELKGKLNGFALRVPVEIVSVINLVAEVKRAVTVEEVNEAFRAAARDKYPKSLSVSDLPLVSVDHRGSPYGSIVDALSTQVTDGTLVSVLAWYDNEWGYVTQVMNLLGYIARVMEL